MPIKAAVIPGYPLPVPVDIAPDSSLTESYMAAIMGFNMLDLGDEPGPEMKMQGFYNDDGSTHCPTDPANSAESLDIFDALVDEAINAQRAGFPGQHCGYTESTMSGETIDMSFAPTEEVFGAVLSEKPSEPAEAAFTTLMIRNIPRKYTQRQLLTDLIAAYDFSGRVDFFYLPIDLGTGRNLGYCFANFVCPTAAAGVKRALHKLRLFAGAKSGLSIGYADVQGFEENVRNVRRSLMHRIKNREYRPLVADKRGELVPVAN
jgi:hypothetical protein